MIFFSYENQDRFGRSTDCCLVLRYYEKGDLFQRIVDSKKTKSLTGKGQKEDELLIAKWMLELCRGVDVMHKEKVIHRDLKPRNIFLDKSEILKIGDFGVSTDKTQAETYVGTPAYLAPELQRAGKYDNKVDMWALGCILLDMLTLTPPPESLASLAERKKLIPSSYHPAWTNLLESLLSQDPKLRKTAQEAETFVKEIQDILSVEILTQETKDTKYDAGTSPSIQNRLEKLKLFAPDSDYWKRVKLPVQLSREFRKQWATILEKFRDPNCASIILTSKDCLVIHYLSPEISKSVLRSFFYSDTNGWKEEELDQTDLAYGLKTTETEDPHKIHVASQSMRLEADLVRENGVTYTVNPKGNLLFVLVDSGAFKCRGYQFFDNGKCSRGSFWTPQWTGPKAKAKPKGRTRSE